MALLGLETTVNGELNRFGVVGVSDPIEIP